MNGVFISICIPAYKNTEFLKRLLDSIAIQHFSRFEVIVTDDSPDESVMKFVKGYSKLPGIKYFRNQPALGTPENWNEGIRRASGEWIKIMHDDDWFADENSLARFAHAAETHRQSFIFSAYTNHFIESGKIEKVFPSATRLKAIRNEPYLLFSKNIIGPPSVTLHRNDGRLFYDKRTKWVVDIDFYIQRMKEEELHFINEPLVNVGMSSVQVTVDCVNNRKVQVPENFALLNKVGLPKLKDIFIYDAWWRLIRNLEITRETEIVDAGYSAPVPTTIKNMIRAQKKLPRRLLTKGVFSKFFMFVHYLLNRKDIPR